jgi:hypothetical protein
MLALPLCSLLFEVVYVFSQYFRHSEFAFITTDVGELIFSGQTIKVTVYGNAQLFFLVSLEINI